TPSVSRQLGPDVLVPGLVQLGWRMRKIKSDDAELTVHPQPSDYVVSRIAITIDSIDGHARPRKVDVTVVAVSGKRPLPHTRNLTGPRLRMGFAPPIPNCVTPCGPWSFLRRPEPVPPPPLRHLGRC